MCGGPVRLYVLAGDADRAGQYTLTMNENAANSVTLRFLAAPTDVGHSGSVDAGTVLEWVDKAAYAAAVGWAKSYCVTAYVGNIHFADPVNSGDMVEVEATIVYTGRSSMHIRTDRKSVV